MKSRKAEEPLAGAQPTEKFRRTDDGTYPNVGEERSKVDARSAASQSSFTGDFPSAQRSADAPTYSPALRRVVETLFLREDEIEATARRLVSELSIGDQRGDYGTVMRRLDEAEENARGAHRLLITARAERDRFEIDAQVVEAALRDKAVAALNAERAQDKESTGKSKMITEADVSLKIVSLFGDEWAALSKDRMRLKLSVEHLEHQVGNWASRCKSLQVIAGKLR